MTSVAVLDVEEHVDSAVGDTAPNQATARSEVEMHREIYTE